MGGRTPRRCVPTCRRELRREKGLEFIPLAGMDAEMAQTRIRSGHEMRGIIAVIVGVTVAVALARAAEDYTQSAPRALKKAA